MAGFAEGCQSPAKCNRDRGSASLLMFVIHYLHPYKAIRFMDELALFSVTRPSLSDLQVTAHYCPSLWTRSTDCLHTHSLFTPSS